MLTCNNFSFTGPDEDGEISTDFDSNFVNETSHLIAWMKGALVVTRSDGKVVGTATNSECMSINPGESEAFTPVMSG